MEIPYLLYPDDPGARLDPPVIGWLRSDGPYHHTLGDLLACDRERLRPAVRRAWISGLLIGVSMGVVVAAILSAVR